MPLHAFSLRNSEFRSDQNTLIEQSLSNRATSYIKLHGKSQLNELPMLVVKYCILASKSAMNVTIKS